jgi:hypothetical protein
LKHLSTEIRSANARDGSVAGPASRRVLKSSKTYANGKELYDGKIYIYFSDLMAISSEEAELHVWNLAPRQIKHLCETNAKVFKSVGFSVNRNYGHTINHRFSLMGPRVRSKVGWICNVRKGTRVGFLRVLLFPLPILIS